MTKLTFSSKAETLDSLYQNLSLGKVKKPYYFTMEQWQTEDAVGLQQELDQIRDLVQLYPMIPALKSVVAEFGGCPEWQNVRPPLVSLTEADRVALIRQLREVGFTMPGLAAQAPGRG